MPVWHELSSSSMMSASADEDHRAASSSDARADGGVSDAAEPLRREASSLREDLLEQGMTPQEASRLAVRASLQTALEASFSHCGRVWLCSSCLLVFGMLCLVCWSESVYNNHYTEYCDQPLAGMLRTLYVIVVVVCLQSEIIRCCLCYNAERDGPYPPCRVRLFKRASLLGTLGWPCVAAYMLFNSKNCSADLRMAVRAITIYYLVIALVVVVLPIISVSLMLCLIRRGLIRAPRSMDAAPDEFVDELPLLRYEADRFDDGPEGVYSAACPICLDGFNERRPISCTPCGETGHAFHKNCLQGWLQCARTCPLCRTDIVQAIEGWEPPPGYVLEPGAEAGSGGTQDVEPPATV